MDLKDHCLQLKLSSGPRGPGNLPWSPPPPGQQVDPTKSEVAYRDPTLWMGPVSPNESEKSPGPKKVRLTQFSKEIARSPSPSLPAVSDLPKKEKKLLDTKVNAWTFKS